MERQRPHSVLSCLEAVSMPRSETTVGAGSESRRTLGPA